MDIMKNPATLPPEAMNVRQPEYDNYAMPEGYFTDMQEYISNPENGVHDEEKIRALLERAKYIFKQVDYGDKYKYSDVIKAADALDKVEKLADGDTPLFNALLHVESLGIEYYKRLHEEPQEEAA